MVEAVLVGEADGGASGHGCDLGHEAKAEL
jgi:hypothetical protein